MSGDHFDEGKPRVDLLDPEALLGISRVLSFGATKYAEHNWRGGIKYSRIIGSILRHLFAIMAGQDTDDESNLPHVDHLGCDVMFLSYYMKNRKEFDDRFTTTRRSSNNAKDAKPHDSGAFKGEGTSPSVRPVPGETTDRVMYPSWDPRGATARRDAILRSLESISSLVDSSTKGPISPTAETAREHYDSLARWETNCRRIS